MEDLAVVRFIKFMQAIINVQAASIEKIKTLLGHKDIKTTLIYIHTATHDVRSPLDDLMDNLDKFSVDINNTLCVDE